MQRHIAVRDVMNLRNKMKVTDLAREGKASLTDLSQKSKVELDWKLNEQAMKDKVFKITINGETAYIDFEELEFVRRVMF